MYSATMPSSWQSKPRCVLLSVFMRAFIRGLSLTKKQHLLVPQGLYHQALIKKYLPWIVIFGTILLVMFIRLTFY